MAGLPQDHRPDARAGALGGVHHDADQRAQGVRHHHLDRARFDPVRRGRDRRSDVAPELRRLERLRARLRDRRVPVHPRHPGAAPERAPLPEGGLAVTTYEIERTTSAHGAPVVKDPSEALPARIGRFAARLPVHIFLAFVAVLWLMPALGLFFTSLLSSEDYVNNGWWKVISHPHL